MITLNGYEYMLFLFFNVVFSLEDLLDLFPYHVWHFEIYDSYYTAGTSLIAVNRSHVAVTEKKKKSLM